MSLCRLIYSSYAKPNLEYHDLRAIMEASERNNKQDGITGMLCYGDSMFLQILEGDRRAVSHTYHRIAADNRHYAPELIECSPIEGRLFTAWAMRAVNLIDLAADRGKHLILKYSGSMTFKPAAMSPSQCLNFMQELHELQQMENPASL